MATGARRLSRALLPALLPLAILACSAGGRDAAAGAPAAAGLHDGAWVGSAFHFPVFARVQVTVTAGRIAAVRILGHFSSEHGKPAEALAATIVQRQSIAVDAVAGATHSSGVILQAAGRALGKARGP